MRTWSDPHARHALLGHAPLVLGILGVLPLLLLALTGFRSAALKVGVILWFVLAAGGAWLARGAGEEAEQAIGKREPALSSVEHSALERHEDLAKWAWIAPIVPAGLGLFMLARGRKMQVTAGLLTLVSSLGVGGYMAYTGHTGGRLVYLYGIGVPARGAPAEGAELQGAPASTQVVQPQPEPEKAPEPVPDPNLRSLVPPPAPPSEPVKPTEEPKPEAPPAEEPKSEPEPPTEPPAEPEEPKPEPPAEPPANPPSMTG